VSRTAPRSFSIALEQLAARLAPRTTLADVQAVWERAAGHAIAAAARPTAERDGVLTITCAAATWAQELDLMASQLIPRLNAELRRDAIRELRCRSG
jgi:predicted nucleic acid-binding Zn ribbon protein